MRLRPELVLLQKTMMTVEGVARRICPDHNIWAAADPVVRRWMLRELSPAARVRQFAEEAAAALRNLARLIEAPPTAAVEVQGNSDARNPLAWFAAGAVAAGAAFVLGMLLR
jgi:ubiquinone biosynthesis protein